MINFSNTFRLSFIEIPNGERGHGKEIEQEPATCQQQGKPCIKCMRHQYHDVVSVLKTTFSRLYRTVALQKQPPVDYRLLLFVMAIWTMRSVVCVQASGGTVEIDLCLICTRSLAWRPLMPSTEVCPAPANWRILVKIVACRMFLIVCTG